MSERKSTIKRKSTETDIAIELNLDGQGLYEIQTEIPFFDHMLSALARHSQIDLKLVGKGDLEVDDHHLVEDVGICLGDAFKEALGDCTGIVRYGHFLLPMEEALVEAALDICGRPYFVYNVTTEERYIKNFEVQLVEEFLRAFCNRLGLNLHVNLKAGKNAHHIYEAVFKAVARSLKMAVKIESGGVPSTKGLLD